jgi:hypothetical protein
MKSVINMSLMMLTLLEAIVEKGIEPLSAIAAGGVDVSKGRPFNKALQKKLNSIPLSLRLRGINLDILAQD